ncbi:hypothetical protein GMORB2_0455 [Geosmithia morbida]|uniref:Leucine carboxyl methyltransferase 1 n=1 Tax=Geosmithia morbida TaxID=1094350 RepID=A0A9P4Z3S1_9HYPO|nr:uncharacterized protein GMORB2_0455 [Geosmithia morbida]KAF4126718.1 hypothetical protein GMORB2_0455 [Geosmithia morbida]
MASVPNLLSLRGTRGGSRGGGRRGGGGDGGRAATADATIQGTDNDAAVSRLSAVDLGYLDDVFARYFVQDVDAPRRLPIINRALDRLVDEFLSNSPDAARQIVSLGAGTDTRPFRLFSRPLRQQGQQQKKTLIYHELDFGVVSARKLRTVRGTPALSRILCDATPVTDDGASWTSRPSSGAGDYHCHGLDLRSLAAAAGKGEGSGGGGCTLPGLRTDVPTLVISECCLCYMSPQEAMGVMSYFTSRIAALSTAIYEPIRPDDPFGRVMVSNLAARRIRMPTLNAYPQPADQEQRLRDAGFSHVKAMTVGDIWRTWVDDKERERVDGLQGLDEVEEWELLAAHYVVVWGGRKGADSDGGDTE